ncbi:MULTISPECIES: hypothetical protein [Rhodomicrobium]|uniref:hypothetical protein n=1 Tax=Rhodomicrobium TaxID=1068 RepID=UPI000B4B7EC5|nr:MULTISPECIES: hypothetical protein [Rhodomicrobium]
MSDPARDQRETYPRPEGNQAKVVDAMLDMLTRNNALESEIAALRADFERIAAGLTEQCARLEGTAGRLSRRVERLEKRLGRTGI